MILIDENLAFIEAAVEMWGGKQNLETGCGHYKVGSYLFVSR